MPFATESDGGAEKQKGVKAKAGRGARAASAVHAELSPRPAHLLAQRQGFARQLRGSTSGVRITRALRRFSIISGLGSCADGHRDGAESSGAGLVWRELCWPPPASIFLGGGEWRLLDGPDCCDRVAALASALRELRLPRRSNACFVYGAHPTVRKDCRAGSAVRSRGFGDAWRRPASRRAPQGESGPR